MVKLPVFPADRFTAAKGEYLKRVGRNVFSLYFKSLHSVIEVLVWDSEHLWLMPQRSQKGWVEIPFL